MKDPTAPPDEHRITEEGSDDALLFGPATAGYGALPRKSNLEGVARRGGRRFLGRVRRPGLGRRRPRAHAWRRAVRGEAVVHSAEQPQPAVAPGAGEHVDLEGAPEEFGLSAEPARDETGEPA